MLNLLVISFIALVAIGVGILLVVLVWQAWQTGQVRVRGLAFDRQQQPGTFWLIIVVCGFSSAIFVCFGVFLFGLLVTLGV